MAGTYILEDDIGTQNNARGASRPEYVYANYTWRIILIGPLWRNTSSLYNYSTRVGAAFGGHAYKYSILIWKQSREFNDY